MTRIEREKIEDIRRIRPFTKEKKAEVRKHQKQILRSHQDLFGFLKKNIHDFERMPTTRKEAVAELERTIPDFKERSKKIRDEMIRFQLDRRRTAIESFQNRLPTNKKFRPKTFDFLKRQGIGYKIYGKYGFVKKPVLRIGKPGKKGFRLIALE